MTYRRRYRRLPLPGGGVYSTRTDFPRVGVTGRAFHSSRTVRRSSRDIAARLGIASPLRPGTNPMRTLAPPRHSPPSRQWRRKSPVALFTWTRLRHTGQMPRPFTISTVASIGGAAAPHWRFLTVLPPYSLPGPERPAGEHYTRGLNAANDSRYALEGEEGTHGGNHAPRSDPLP